MNEYHNSVTEDLDDQLKNDLLDSNSCHVTCETASILIRN